MTNDELDAIRNSHTADCPCEWCNIARRRPLPRQTTPILVVDGYDIQEWRDRALQAEGKLLFETCYGQDQHSRAGMYSDVCDLGRRAFEACEEALSNGYLQPVTASACIDQEKARKAISEWKRLRKEFRKE